jgi:hypothetical protein
MKRSANKFFSFSTLCLALASLAVADDAFTLYGVPDHDQRRIALPGKGGMYCAPTSAWNMLDFMRLHGVTSLKYLPSDPSGSILAANKYIGHDMRIAAMGTFMNTDPTDGTNGDGLVGGLVSYLNMCNVPALVINYAKDDNFPSPQVAMNWMRLGGLVEFCFGYYTNPYGFNKDRDGGHCLTMNGVYRKDTAIPNPANFPWLPNFTSSFHCDYRDPAQDEGKNDPNRLKKQSPVTSRSYDFFAENANFDGTTTTLFGVGKKPTVDTNPDVLNWRYSYVDGYTIVVPFVVLTNVLNSDNLSIKLGMSYNPEKARYSPNAIQSISPGARIAGDVVLDPVAPEFLRTNAANGIIMQGEIGDRTSRIYGRVPEAAYGLTFGGQDLSLFALGKKGVYKLDRRGKYVANAKLPMVAEAIAYDDIRNHVIVVAGTSVVEFDANLRPLRTATVPDLRGEGRLTLRTDPKTGDLFALRAGGSHVVHLWSENYSLIGLLTLPRVTNPLSFDFDQFGNLLVSDAGVLKTFSQRGEILNTRWDNLQVGAIIRTGRSFNNMTNTRCPFPAWRNLEDPQVPLGDTGGVGG